MARVSLIEEKDCPALGQSIDRIRGGRARLLNLYKALLHSPDVAGAWFDYSNAVRRKTQLDGRMRELAIIRVGILNRAEYVIKQHVPALAIEAGLTREHCDALVDWPNSALFDDRERAVLACTDAMTRDVRVSDAVHAALRRHFGEREIVELTVVIGMYNMHSRVLEALEIDLEASGS